MADQKVTDLTNYTAVPADADELYFVDVSDTTDDAAGSSKAITVEDLMQFHRPAVYTHSGSTNVTTSAATVAFDTESLDPSASYSVSAGIITVSGGTGVYCVSYSVPIQIDDDTGDQRSAVDAKLQKASGGSYSDVAGSDARGYLRETSVSGGGVSHSFLCSLTDADTIKVVVAQLSAVNVSTLTGKASLSIHRIG